MHSVINIIMDTNAHECGLENNRYTAIPKYSVNKVNPEVEINLTTSA